MGNRYLSSNRLLVCPKTPYPSSELIDYGMKAALLGQNGLPTITGETVEKPYSWHFSYRAFFIHS